MSNAKLLRFDVTICRSGRLCCRSCSCKTLVLPHTKELAPQRVCIECYREKTNPGDESILAKNYNVFAKGSQPSKMTFKKVHLICNPFSGGKRGLELLAKAVPVLQKHEIEVIVLMTEHAGHAKELVQNIELKDAILAIGGDGTVHEIVNGMMSRADKAIVPIGMIPAGEFLTTMFPGSD